MKKKETSFVNFEFNKAHNALEARVGVKRVKSRIHSRLTKNDAKTVYSGSQDRKRELEGRANKILNKEKVLPL